MQVIFHKNTTLTICQKFFIEKSLELLSINTIDSYRVRLNNSKSILEELNYCLKEFSKGRIKHFQTIKAKDKESKAIVNETIVLIKSDNYLKFTTFSKDYFKQLLENLNENNYKKVISCIEILLKDNINYLQNTIQRLEELLKVNSKGLNHCEEIDNILNTIFSELISKGFSKNFLYKRVYGVFVASLDDTKNFEDHFNNFKTRILNEETSYNVIFRIDTTKKVYDAISAIDSNNAFIIKNNIEQLINPSLEIPELIMFKQSGLKRKFILCENVSALDYFSALKNARITLSEYLDVINLGLSDETLEIHNRVLVIDNNSPEKGKFQSNINVFDGKYKVGKEHYLKFTGKIPLILDNSFISKETKEKIKSAVRYLRLGNQSTEVEHKFINYWIGLEYLFSNYESQSTINRLKEHFITAHSLAYVKRNIYSFNKVFNQLSTTTKSSINKFNTNNLHYLLDKDFYTSVEETLINQYPLISYRAMKLKSWFFENDKLSNAKKYIERHKSNLEIHFTRIYRLRNEIIHDAVTNTNNEQITSNLRYYLTFILNELIDYFSNSHITEVSIEDFFVLNEIKLGNLTQDGYKLEDLMNVNCSIDFIN